MLSPSQIILNYYFFGKLLLYSNCTLGTVKRYIRKNNLQKIKSWLKCMPSECLFRMINFSIYFTIQLIFATFHGSHCTF